MTYSWKQRADSPHPPSWWSQASLEAPQLQLHAAQQPLLSSLLPHCRASEWALVFALQAQGRLLPP